MKTNLAKKLLTMTLTAVILLNPFSLMAQDSKDGNFVDDSLQDLTIVLASGAVGAVLGLSTLSFVDKPKDHTKNIAIGGAIGIVVGVGLVIFNQATKPSVLTQTELMNTPESAESYARLDFSQQKIAESYLQQPTVGYNFTF